MGMGSTIGMRSTMGIVGSTRGVGWSPSETKMQQIMMMMVKIVKCRPAALPPVKIRGSGSPHYKWKKTAVAITPSQSVQELESDYCLLKAMAGNVKPVKWSKSFPQHNSRKCISSTRLQTIALLLISGLRRPFSKPITVTNYIREHAPRSYKISNRDGLHSACKSIASKVIKSLV